jgi:hypothetical protein
VLLDLSERDLRLGLGQLHKRQQLHLGQVVLVLQTKLIHKFTVALVELLVAVKLVGHENLQQVVNELACGKDVQI